MSSQFLESFFQKKFVNCSPNEIEIAPRIPKTAILKTISVTKFRYPYKKSENSGDTSLNEIEPAKVEKWLFGYKYR